MSATKKRQKRPRKPSPIKPKVKDVIYTLGTVTPRIATSAFVAPDAVIIGDVELAEESSIWFKAILRGDIERITVGRGSNIQDGSVMHTDPNNPCIVGEHVTVGHKAMLHGCNIGNNTLIGIGATLLNGSKIGANCIVGAHSLVTENKTFPDNVLIMGAPAKIARELRPDELDKLRANADRYVDRAQRYKTELRAQPSD
jgi:carbonic anhydrase/acetyltransferase-like protein (isoleucine patch superfamily)